MKTLKFTQEQVTKILEEIAKKEDGFNQLMKISLEALMRSEREEHNKMHQDVSNGYRKRRTYGKGSILELQVPRSRYGQFYPILLSIIRDQESESQRLAFSLYGAGLTTQQVGELFEEIYGQHYSKSSISRLFAYAREEVSGWLERPLDEYYPIVYIDATFISVRREESVSKESFYTVLGVKADRTREVLSIINLPTESALGWAEVLKSLRERGVKEIGLVISDGLKGLEDAIASVFSGVAHQLCTTHLKRNVGKHVKKKDKKEVMEDLKEVFITSDSKDTPEKGWQRWILFTTKWGKKYPGIKKMGNNQRYRLYFTYLAYDYRIRSMIYSTNWIERLNRDYKRVTRMRGALPNPDAVLLLLGRVALSRKAYWRKIPKLNYENKMFKWDDE